jgi:hypothetical protein
MNEFPFSKDVHGYFLIVVAETFFVGIKFCTQTKQK